MSQTETSKSTSVASHSCTDGNSIEQGNRLIAEFMSYDYSMYKKWIDDEDSVKDRQIEVPLDADDLEYHTSWDWLMPVVEKIEQTHAFAIDYNPAKKYGTWVGIHIPSYDPVGLTTCIIQKTGKKIEAVWQAVIEFIKWYNQSKTNQP